MRTLLIAALCVIPAAQDSKDEFSSRDHGFKIKRPDAGWTFQEIPVPAGATYALRIAKADAAKEHSVTIYIADRGAAADLKAVLDSAEASHQKSGTQNLARTKDSIAFDVKAGADTYRLVQRYVLDGDRVFILQTAALPSADRKPLDAIAKTFALAAGPDADLARLAARCGSEIDWAKDWDDAAVRANKGRRLIAVVFELYAAFKVPQLAPSTLFMDPDVVDLMQRHFVGLRWRPGMKAPIQDPAVYGIGAGAFGRALVFFTPDGKVVGDTVAFEPVFVDHYARRILRERGDLDEAKDLEKETDPLRRARWLRRLRRGPEALDEVKKAPDGPDRLAEEGLILLRLGRTVEGIAVLERMLRNHAKSDRAPEARYLLGVAKADVAIWRALAKDKPENRWAWRAAAAIENLERGLAVDRLAWCDAETVAVAEDSRSEVIEDVAKAEQDGVAYLLKTQRKDGSWIVPTQVGTTAQAFITATTSICGSALIRFGRKDEVRRALDYVLAAEPDAQGKTAFNYGIWGRCFALRFLADCAAARIGDRDKIARAMQSHIDALEKEQAGLGGWSYANLTEVGGAKDPSMGFVTAAVLLAILDAKEQGARVAPRTIQRATACLESMKGSAGSYSYMGGTARVDAESSRRSPVYALALKRAGAGDAVEASLGHYLKFLEATRKERTKTLCHTSPEGTASYYLLYGARFAAEAAAGASAEIKRALVKDVLSFRCADGGFLDSPVEGRTYGTGMALIALGYTAR